MQIGKHTPCVLRHPLRPAALPERARVVAYYYQNGRNVGLVLCFGDGHTASLLYNEIAALQETAVREMI